jgi:hypothetical protein
VAVRAKGDGVLLGVRAAGDYAVEIASRLAPPALFACVLAEFVLLSLFVCEPLMTGMETVPFAFALYVVWIVNVPVVPPAIFTVALYALPIFARFAPEFIASLK